MTTTIGRLRHRVNLQSATTTRDAGGGVTESWSTVAQIYCDIKPVSGSERYRQGKVQESLTHEIVMRHRTGIDTNYRINFESRNFNVRSIRNIDERDRFLVLLCTEGEAI